MLTLGHYRIGGSKSFFIFIYIKTYFSPFLFCFSTFTKERTNKHTHKINKSSKSIERHPDFLRLLCVTQQQQQQQHSQ